MKYNIQEINSILKSIFLQEKKNTIITQVCIDTRQITHAEQTLFFCLIARNDGHQHIEQAYKKGIRNFIVSKKMDCINFQEANFILVENTLKALQQLAQYHRGQYKIPVIGITGSNGKTIVKEWLYQLLSAEKNTVKSPKSYNSQVGVPLSVLNMEPDNELAIFEAGISTINEMENLQKIIQPTIGILTNIGSAHDAGFSSTEEKIKEKLKLFDGCEMVIFSSDYEVAEQLSKQYAVDSMQLISFGKNVGDTFQITRKEKKNNSTLITINSKKSNIQHSAFSIPFTDDASIENCLHCVVTLLHLGFSLEKIQEKILLLRNLPMRLELKYGINNCTIIDDSYSADFHSFLVALDFLKQQESHKKKTLIISEFEDSGLNEKDFILKLKTVLQQTKFDKLIGVGKAFMHHIESLAYVVKEWYVFESTDQMLEQFNVLKFESEIILLKGARKFAFEKITAQLIGQTHATALEINLNALVSNLNVYRSYLQKNCGVIAMVKAFSYGSGSVEVASLLEKQHVDYLAVAYTDEGVELRKNGIKTPIMVMNPDAVDFDRMLENKLEPEIYSLKILNDLIKFLTVKSSELLKSSELFAIHIKLETGMNRLGFTENELDELISTLHLHNNILVKTVFSHLAASEDAQLDTFTNEQIAVFGKLSEKLIAAFDYPVKKHLVNSSGILRFPNAHYDYVRLGIGLYGVDSSASIQNKLEPIGKLKTRVAQIKPVKKGETIGYSRKGIAAEDMKIGVLAIGYADGYDRRLGNGIGEVFIAGQRAKIVGNICMDMCMVDLTHIDEVNEGDECEIYGKEISIIEQAKKIGTIAYELLTHISSRVKRLYYLD
jgi:alanine racemase